jgi:DNA-binding beta-propeller fold protein YncE
MTGGNWVRRLLGPCALAAVAMLAVAAPALGAASDPLFVFVPKPAGLLSTLPPPTGFLEGPCGMGVDPAGRFYVSDYYHDVVDAYDQNADYTIPPPPGKPPTGATGYLGQLAGIDPIDGPCGLAFDAAGSLYVNDYHRAVKRYTFAAFGAFGTFGAATTITGATTPEGTHPTGVAVDPATGNVYVDQRDHVSVFDESGQPVMEGAPGSEVPVHIGGASLKDGYGIAFSTYPGTEGLLYVPDAAGNTIRVYDTATPQAGPVETIGGSETPKGEFVSLRDASIAVDRVTGEVYVIDDLQPEYTSEPQAIVYAFAPDGTYEGHLKFLVTWGMPSGLAVDNSATPTQGRVYVTSGNSTLGGIYAYGPGAATTAPIALPSAAAPAPPEPGAAQGEDWAPAGSAPGLPADPSSVQATTQTVSPAAAPSPRPRLHRARKGKAPRHHRRRRAHRSSPGAVKGHR